MLNFNQISWQITLPRQQICCQLCNSMSSVIHASRSTWTDAAHSPVPFIVICHHCSSDIEWRVNPFWLGVGSARIGCVIPIISDPVMAQKGFFCSTHHRSVIFLDVCARLLSRSHRWGRFGPRTSTSSPILLESANHLVLMVSIWVDRSSRRSITDRPPSRCCEGLNHLHFCSHFCWKHLSLVFFSLLVIRIDNVITRLKYIVDDLVAIFCWKPIAKETLSRPLIHRIIRSNSFEKTRKRSLLMFGRSDKRLYNRTW